MNINFTMINEIISFIVFFFFSYIYISPILIKKINFESFNDFKNFIFNEHYKTVENIFLLKIEKKEIIFKKIIDKYLNKILLKIDFKKKIFFDLIYFEKKFFLKKIKKIINLENLNKIKNFFFKLKNSFLTCFKKMYYEIINFNNEFLLL